MSRRSRWLLLGVAVIVLALAASAQRLATFYTDFLWYRALGFGSVWSKTLMVQLGLGTVFTLLLFGLLWSNLWAVERNGPDPGTYPGRGNRDQLVSRWHQLIGTNGRWADLVLAGVFSLIGGTSAHSQWDDWLLFSNGKSFPGKTDPIYHMNYGFYVFRLPFLQWLTGWVFSAMVLALLLSLLAHYLNGGIAVHSGVVRVGAPVKAHISVLLGVIALVQGGNYYLQRLALVTERNYAPVDGATYTDIHALSPALVLLIAISVIAAGFFFYNARQQGWLLPGAGVVVWALVWLLAANLYPAAIQRWVVEPSQETKEGVYVTDNIQATWSAYGLGSVNEVQYPAQPTVAPADIDGTSPQSGANRQTIANISVLDAATSELSAAFDQLEVGRGYYTMSAPSPDRYVLDTGPDGHPQETPVLISARELYPSGVPGSWVVSHLEYTHGFGAVVSPSDQSGVTGSGNPAFTLAGVPPKGEPSLDKQPRAYFGTNSGLRSGYVVAGSDQAEVDYEDPSSGTEKYYTAYSPTDSPAAGGLLRRIAFALRFTDVNFLLSSQVTSTSRVLFYRNVTQRLQEVAPFLAYDSQPYPVVTGGRLYWVEDAYTLSNTFPYAEHADDARLPGSSGLAQQPFNYVRDSVKAVVDAYSGKVRLFAQDPDDPVLQTYEAAFPKLFTPMADADKYAPGITDHWRYAYDLFVVQTNMWASYHVSPQDATTFFDNSQRWSSPTYPPGAYEYLGSRNKSMMPVYELMALPGSSDQSFVLVQPFVPASNGNAQTLTAVMTAGPEYGQLTDYVAPAAQPFHGPQSVVTAILTDKSISTEITQLGQHGSSVVLGSLITVPIAGSIMYVQSLYVTTSKGIPHLADVIVDYDNNVYHSGGPSLADTLCQVRNPDGVAPFASLCPGARRATPGGSTRGATSSTTTPKSTTTSAPVGPTTTAPITTAPSPSSSTTTSAPPPAGSVSYYLAQAQRDFSAAQRALARGDLASYQSANDAAAAAVAQAQQAEQRQALVTSTTSPTSTSATSTRPGRSRP